MGSLGEHCLTAKVQWDHCGTIVGPLFGHKSFTLNMYITYDKDKLVRRREVHYYTLNMYITYNQDKLVRGVGMAGTLEYFEYM